MYYSEKELVRIARRMNNNKRNYLVVNPLQGKHIPVRPSEALALFKKLALMVKEKYPGDKLLLIGFAETATAIGAAVARECNAMYIQTTREDIEGAKYLIFSEQHSHAAEQRLVRNDIDDIKDEVERVVFVEDELTTGNTILNIIDIFNRQYPQIKNFSAASILNGMNEEAIEKYRQRGIGLIYVLKTDHENYSAIAQNYKIECPDADMASEAMAYDNRLAGYNYFELNSCVDGRRLVQSRDYEAAVEELCGRIEKMFDFSRYRSVLVLGTEEFMYPALRAAEVIERLVPDVRFHASTRSPIEVSGDKEYPLHKRFELKSLYDKERKTYIYDLKKYDCVLVITDAPCKEKESIRTLSAAIAGSGNDNINIIRWCR